jgi:hypothetical protein
MGDDFQAFNQARVSETGPRTTPALPGVHNFLLYVSLQFRFRITTQFSLPLDLLTEL